MNEKSSIFGNNVCLIKFSNRTLTVFGHPEECGFRVKKQRCERNPLPTPKNIEQNIFVINLIYQYSKTY